MEGLGLPIKWSNSLRLLLKPSNRKINYFFPPKKPIQPAEIPSFMGRKHFFFLMSILHRFWGVYSFTFMHLRNYVHSMIAVGQVAVTTWLSLSAHGHTRVDRVSVACKSILVTTVDSLKHHVPHQDSQWYRAGSHGQPQRNVPPNNAKTSKVEMV